MDQIKKYVYAQLAAGKLTTEEAGQLLKELRELEAEKAATLKQDIAIIGMAGRIADSEDLDEFWQTLRNGKDCVRPLPLERMENVEEYLKVMGLTTDDVKFREGAYLRDIDKFDPDFFKISAGEANLLDPNQRLFLQTAWQAIEDAGYGGDKLADTLTGVFVGFSHDFGDSYKTLIKNYAPALLTMATIGNINSVITGRLSYLLDLKGMSLLTDTACSSALIAVHLACRSIQSGDCDVAIAGGVKTWLIPAEPKAGGEFGGDGGPGIGIEAKDSRTHAFDDNSTGAGFGEGVGAVILKPLKKAIEDGDSIYAVIKGSAANQDGKSIGISAPNVLSQEAVIQRAWKNAGINPESVSYIEAHGTGTRLGDPIEIYALQNSFSKFTKRKHLCAVGSVKTNVGHLDNAAGIAGLMKVVLSLKNRELPPSINFEKPNREINFIDSPVYVNDKLKPWTVESAPRRAGISAFGLSGTNCHIVLEEAPEIVRRQAESRPEAYLFVLSAGSGETMQRLIAKYITYCETHPDADLGDISYTASTGRGHYHHRLAIVAKDVVELQQKLIAYLSGKVTAGEHAQTSQPKTSSEELQRINARAGELVKKLADTKNPGYSKDLNELAGLYIRGAEIDWAKLYKGQKFYHVNLPVYQFERKKCWVKPTHFAESRAKQKETVYYETHWIPEKFIAKNPDYATASPVIIFTDTQGISKDIAASLKSAGVTVIEVEIGNEFAKIAPEHYTIDGSEFDYLKLFVELGSQGISRILHFASLNHTEVSNLETLQGAEKSGVYSLLYIAKSLQKIKPSKTIELVIIADYANSVTGREAVLKPENAPIIGLGKVVNQEFPEIKCRCLDIDQTIDSAALLTELTAENPAYLVAYREGHRYSEELKVANLSEQASDFTVQKGGVYIITGGLGGVGLEMARFLAKAEVKLALINRTTLPARSQWDNILQTGQNEKLCKKLQTIRELEEEGSEVRIYSADVADLTQMEQILADIRSSYGQINGIMHAAGVAGDGLIITRDSETFGRTLAPKVAGTLVLHQLTKEDKLDFFIMFSSVSSIFGGPGQGDYSAANLYLDSFAAYRHLQGKPALTINWTAWQETGMAVDYRVNFDHLIFKPLSTSSAINHFAQIFQKGLTKILIGEINYPRFATLMDKLPIKLSTEIVAATNAALGKPGHSSAEPGTEVRVKDSADEIERRLAHIWAQILGLNEVSINDNFYDLGGDSIIALTLINEIKKEYPGTVDVTDLFSRPTIKGLAELIKHSAEPTPADTDDSDDLMNLLEQLEKGELSSEDGVKLLSNLEVRNP